MSRLSVFRGQPPFKGRIPDDAKCIRCGRPAEERHHVFAGHMRGLAEAEGLWAYMCRDCHRGADGVHAEKRRNGHSMTDSKHLRWAAQQAWETRYIRDNHATDEEARAAWFSLAPGMASYEAAGDDAHADWVSVWGRGLR